MSINHNPVHTAEELLDINRIIAKHIKDLHQLREEMELISVKLCYILQEKKYILGDIMPHHGLNIELS
jgi:hypothetical protein